MITLCAALSCSAEQMLNPFLIPPTSSLISTKGTNQPGLHHIFSHRSRILTRSSSPSRSSSHICTPSRRRIRHHVFRVLWFLATKIVELGCERQALIVQSWNCEQDLNNACTLSVLSLDIGDRDENKGINLHDKPSQNNGRSPCSSTVIPVDTRIPNDEANHETDCETDVNVHIWLDFLSSGADVMAPGFGRGA